VAVAPAYAAKILAYYVGKENARLQIVPARPDGSWSRAAAAALVVTRLHHVPGHEQVVAAFREGAGGDLLRHRGVGYDVYVAPRLR
jgi:hypothetical protein